MRKIISCAICITLPLLVACSSMENLTIPLQCDTNSTLVFQGKILKIKYLDEEVFFENEPLMATASLVDMKILEVEKGDCTGNYVQVKLIETTPGRLMVRAKPKITIVDPMVLHPPKFARWDFE